MNRVKWDEQFKIRIANSRPEFLKHEMIKTALVCKIMNKYRKNKHFLRIYTEFPIDESGLITDVYIEDIKQKSIICYEIQKEISKAWKEKKIKQYNNLDIPFFNTIDLVIIPLKEFSNDIYEINNKLEEYAV